MPDGIIARHGQSFCEPHENGNICNGGSATTQLYQQQQQQQQPKLYHNSSTPPKSASSSPAKKSLPSTPTHIFGNGSISLGAAAAATAGSSSNAGCCNGEFKLCGYDGGFGEDCSTASVGTSPAEIFGILGFWLKLRHDLKSVPWKQMRAIKMKNARAAPGCAYIPTKIEHIANVLTHGLWVLPSVYAGLNLYFRSYTGAQMLSAVIYGIALTMLFFVSTFFHCVFYCNRNRQLKDVLHRCDRAMIYIFIAGSYYPWLSLGHTSHPQIVSVVKWCVWAMAILGIIYQQIFHERYKCLETFFYTVIGVVPSLMIVFWGHEFTAMTELKLGGFLYIVGIGFFKSDGIFPFAHAIWHLFVVMAATVHYFAILNHLYPVETVGSI